MRAGISPPSVLGNMPDTRGCIDILSGSHCIGPSAKKIKKYLKYWHVGLSVP